jgi:hypothetical protein
MQFTKLFSSILDSTIWQEAAETRLVWITMLAMADRAGEVHASVPGLAKRAGVTLQQCEAALQCLTSPDPYSRTPEFEGRRIAAIDGGWTLLNHAKYRQLLSIEERREYNRRKQAEYRAGKKSDVNDPSAPVSKCVSNAHSTEAEAEAKPEREREVPSALVRAPIPRDGEGAPIQPMDALQAKIQGLKPAWKMPFTHAEMRALMESAKALDSLTPGDWQVLKDYLQAKLPEGMPSYRPNSRLRFIENAPDIWAYAFSWKQKQAGRPAKAAPVVVVAEQTDEDKAALEEFLKKSKGGAR